MYSNQKKGAFAAFANAFVAIVTIYVAVVMIGLDVLTDQSLFAEIAINNPTPLIIQDVMKFISAACWSVLYVTLFKQLHNAAIVRMKIATLFGFISILLLLTNSIFSLITINQAGELAAANSENANDLNRMIGILAMATIFTNGLWYLLTSWTALKANQLPKGLNYFGLAIGAISLIPILGIFALLLSIIWFIWLGRVLFKEASVQAHRIV
ncbi:DUF4386 family protein [Cyclobacterium sp.]|uniref:DUF4386 family protein n=1 Tax=Cyclobacterium sp. TaxID=1966343 RepID=UPI001994F869|nr:DUF4386 family protein [Cyclobacterium sp.]MBD3627870.1 DUF4386 family protein [Cyclobacterium sp.]